MSRFHCDTPDRRALLVGLGAGAPLLALMLARPGFRRRPGEGLFSVGDIVDADGDATALARRLSGTTIRLRGFPAPALRADAAFDLFQGVTGPCLACGLIHAPGASIAVRGDRMPFVPSQLSPVEIAGRLDIDDTGNARLTLLSA